MAKGQNRVLVIAAETLNDYADHIERGVPLANYSPSAPSIWFDGMAREVRNLRGTSWEALLTPTALARFLSVTAPCDDCHRTDGTHDLDVEH